MDTYETIRSRYSCRSYQPRPVEGEKLARILEAARLAPSARNRQEWKLVVVQDASLRAALAQASDAFIGQAPVLLAMVGLHPDRIMSCQIPADPVDCSIALEHVALAATAEGLGTCWIGRFDQEKVRGVLNVPPDAKVVGLMPLGYPADEHAARPRKSLDELVCYDRFAS